MNFRTSETKLKTQVSLTVFIDIGEQISSMWPAYFSLKQNNIIRIILTVDLFGTACHIISFTSSHPLL